MEEVKNFGLALGGAAAPGLMMLLAFTLTKKAIELMGAIGDMVTRPRGQGLTKKAQDYRDYRENVRKGKGTGLKAMQYRFQENKSLKRQAAEARAKSRSAQYGVGNKHGQSLAQSNAQINAINAGNAARFAAGVAAGTTVIGAGMSGKAAGDKYVAEAMQAQQERAISEAIKDVELSAKINPGDVNEMGKKLSEAIKNGDSIEARAYQNMLMKSGGPGTAEYRKVMNGVTQAQMDPSTVTGSTVSALKQNMLTNHGGIKETAADLIKHASDQPDPVTGQARTMAQVSADPDTWKLSNEDLVKQKSHSIEQAVTAQAIKVKQAREIQDDEQLWRRLDQKGRDQMNKAAGRVK